jgi:hypothetical protein
MQSSPAQQDQPQLPNPNSKSINGPSPNPYPGNTNININFPMYMCPPHPSYPTPTTRYTSPPPPMMNPYMGYQYPYMPNQTNPNTREGSHSQAQKNPTYPPHNFAKQHNSPSQYP